MRIALGISYEGTAYCGWQSQEVVPSIQSSLESAVSKVANHVVTLTCAGRTDAGVHALGQVAHFDTTAERDERAARSVRPAHPKVLVMTDILERILAVKRDEIDAARRG